MNNELNLALVGASGVVGQKIIQLLEKKNFQVNNFYPLGKSSVGDEVSLMNQTYVIDDVDLFDATKIHTVLNSRLGFKRPFYFHHKLICDENGKRLAKRDDSKSLQKYRQEGFKASEIKEILGFK